MFWRFFGTFFMVFGTPPLSTLPPPPSAETRGGTQMGVCPHFRHQFSTNQSRMADIAP